MKKRVKAKWLAAALALCLCLLIAPGHARAAAQTGTVYATVERFTIGQSFLKEPTEIPIYDGDTYVDVLTRILGGTDKYISTGSGSSFYLSGIYNADTGVLKVPDYLKSLSGGTVNDSLTNSISPTLSEKCYTSQSGWMYSVNNVFPGVGFGSQVPVDGDVVRYQYSMYGLGADLGESYSGKQITTADKGTLVKTMAALNASSDSAALKSKAVVSQAYDNAVSVMEDVPASQTRVDKANSWLTHAVAGSALSGIGISQSKASLSYGDDLAVYVVYTPSDASIPEGVTWTTSDDEVVSLVTSTTAPDKVTLHTEGVGNATITATLGDYKAECEVTVSQAGTTVKGDVNRDGKVTSKDATRIIEYVNDPEGASLAASQLTAGDVNGDGKVTSKDATRIIEYVNDPTGAAL